MSNCRQLDSIRRKLEAGLRLTAEDGLALLRPDVDVHEVGSWANRVRQQRHGKRAYYNLNAHLNPTNVCVYRCPLCAYSRQEGDPDAYVMEEKDWLSRGAEAMQSGCTEVHIVGGLHPRRPPAWYEGILASLHRAFPALHLKAFTAVEIAWFSQQSGRSIESVLSSLIEAGLGSLPGGGAEIFDPGIRAIVAPRKPSADTWLLVHRLAHRLGLKSNATLLYGHVERPEHRIDHLIRLRDLQDETAGFQAFVPLAFHPKGTQLAVAHGPSGLDHLRMVAVSRLLLDNFDHIKAYWISLGVGTAQVALGYGADDLDGTVRHEKIHHEAGSQSPEMLSVAEIRRLIVEAGCEPVERDSLYRPVERPARRAGSSV